uniref:J domain-containing protein n=2 Tax=Electrophorus electricus TaxID=8005 RepID=A0AAY5ECQ8_ELEEL
MTGNDVSSVRGSRGRLAVLTDSTKRVEPGVPRDTSCGRGARNVSVDCLPRRAPEWVALRDRVDPSAPSTGSRSSASRSGAGRAAGATRRFSSDARLRGQNGGASDSASRDPPPRTSETAYYKLLEVSPSATQAQIKAAYYRQSFICHPDKNAGSEHATLRFAQVSEAYNVLGNKALRRKYDRGLLDRAEAQAPGGASSARGAAGEASRSDAYPRRAAAFDFDAFYRAHYGEQLQREKERRDRREEVMRKRMQHNRDWGVFRMAEVTVWMMMAMAAGILLSLKAD